jgi:Alpha-L-fucosidase/Alpha-L-fucosidase C-terminal domain
MNSTFTRRQFAKLTAVAAAFARLPQAFAQSVPPPRQIAPGPFKPTWKSLTSNYKTPEWFRDAKFGMWAHWTAQCVPEQGDWYARRMYIQGEKDCDYHVKNAVYAFVRTWPVSRVVKIKSLATSSSQVAGAKVTNISLLGYGGKLTWTQDERALLVNLPEKAPGQDAVTLKINGLQTA